MFYLALVLHRSLNGLPCSFIVLYLALSLFSRIVYLVLFTVLKMVTLILHCSLKKMIYLAFALFAKRFTYLALVLFPIGRQYQVQVWGGLGLAGGQIEQRKGLPLHPALTLDISRQSLMVTF